MYNKDTISICKNLDNIFNDINDAQNKTINQTIRNESVEKMIGKFDGKCSERAVNEILKVIR